MFFPVFTLVFSGNWTGYLYLEIGLITNFIRIFFDFSGYRSQPPAKIRPDTRFWVLVLTTTSPSTAGHHDLALEPRAHDHARHPLQTLAPSLYYNYRPHLTDVPAHDDLAGNLPVHVPAHDDHHEIICAPQSFDEMAT